MQLFTLFSRRQTATLLSEASALEDELGADHAIEMLRQQIAEADRKARKRLYRLHDELVRRRNSSFAPATLG